MAFSVVGVVVTIVGPFACISPSLYHTHNLERTIEFKLLQLCHLFPIACDHGLAADCFEFAEWLHWFTSMWLPFMWNDGINTLSDMLTVSSMILSPLTLKYTINSPLHMMLMSLP